MTELTNFRISAASGLAAFKAPKDDIKTSGPRETALVKNRAR